MGKLIQCSSHIAKKPYHFRLTDTNVYSIEEVCYYIRHNIYMMQEEVFNSDFAVWLRDELGMKNTARKIENMLYDHRNLKDIVVTLCCSCDYYDEAEINEIIHIIDRTSNLPIRKRQKIEADNFLQCGSYQKALEGYEHILRSDDMLRADITEYGAIYHNIGVSLANLGEYGKAAVAFSHAYEKGKDENALKSCIFAYLLGGDENGCKEICKKFDVQEDTIQAIKQEYLRKNEASHASKDVRRVQGLKNLLKSGNLTEYYDKVNSYIYRWKEEYRSEISV